ncbi:hypothetical protein HPB48_024413 [Haemaphysalis longicornis]|uniref:Testis-expressed sequence 264 protein n=1 Tax=Haemaphysalis longicornis TaxID=44386 RepID=A0A9J6H952_HAELO|nr:hypothetical protein HPB48_024413 [Haemaphysalis longicornis]
METDVALLLGIIVVLILLVLTLLGFLSYCGLFAPIDIKAEKPPFKELQVAYKFCRGSYKNSGALFTEVHSIAPSLKCIGVYYDDPNEVEPLRLRYLVGVVLNDTDQPAAPAVKEQLEAEGFKTARFPAVDHAVTTVFPFRGSVSVMIAMARVYPKLREYIKEKLLCARPLMEIYEDDRVLFVCPLAKQDEFYVEEATEEPEEATPPATGPRPTATPRRATTSAAHAAAPLLPSRSCALSPHPTDSPSSLSSSLHSGQQVQKGALQAHIADTSSPSPSLFPCVPLVGFLFFQKGGARVCRGLCEGWEPSLRLPVGRGRS